MAIQVVEYCHANNIPFMEGCVIKYVSRHRDKGGIEDLKKAKHFIEMLIELESKKIVGAKKYVNKIKISGKARGSLTCKIS